MLEPPVRLDMNEVPFLPPPNVIAAARKGLSRLNRYADAEELARLRCLLAGYAGADHERVILGPGSEILLREIIHAFAGTRKVVTPSPSFLPIVEAARETAASWTGLRLSPPGFELHPEVLLSETQGPCLVIIDNPNNPTGHMMLNRQTVQAVVENEEALLVIDEAYAEFARTDGGDEEARASSFVDMVECCANLAVTRTMDKAFSLAGARVGYAILGEAFRKAFASFYALLPQPSLGAALEALKDPAYVEQNVGRLIEERERLRQALQDLDARVYASHSNFLLVRSRMPDMAARLRDSGVLVSDVSNQLPTGFIRVSIGTRRENDAFLAAYRRLMEEM